MEHKAYVRPSLAGTFDFWKSEEDRVFGFKIVFWYKNSGQKYLM